MLKFTKKIWKSGSKGQRFVIPIPKELNKLAERLRNTDVFVIVVPNDFINKKTVEFIEVEE